MDVASSVDRHLDISLRLHVVDRSSLVSDYGENVVVS